MAPLEGPSEFLEGVVKHPVRTLVLLVLAGVGIVLVATLTEMGEQAAAWLLGRIRPSETVLAPPTQVRRPEATPEPTTNPSVPPAAPDPQTTSKQRGIFVDCEWEALPTVVPPDGHVRILVTREDGSFTGLEDTSGPPAARMMQRPSAYGYRCQLTNYSNAVLFNLSIPVNLTFMQAIPWATTGSRAGEITLRRDWTFSIPKLDPFPAAPYTFYIANFAPDRFVRATLPKIVSANDNEEVPMIEANRHLDALLGPAQGNVNRPSATGP